VIHLYPFKDLNILIDTGSGAVHTVSDVARDLLRSFAGDDENEGARATWDATKRAEVYALKCKGAYSAADVDAAVSEIDALVEADMLFSDDDAGALLAVSQRGAVIKAMCLHVAHDCNMRCAYCFADTGGFSGERSLMPVDTGKAAIDFLIARSGSRRNLEIDFFGGEPIMNFDAVKTLVRYGREREKLADKHIRFTITTNGLLLDEEKTAFINAHMDNVIISIDGRPAVNDRVRKTPDGGNAYDRVLGNLIRFREAREKAGKLYYVRGTFTGYNKDFSEDVRHLADLGFANVSVEPVVTDEARDFALTEGDLPVLFAEYDRLADLCISRADAGTPISFFHFNVDMTQGPCAYKRAAGCGAGTEYVAVTPDGDVYPCHQCVGDARFIMGNVHSNTDDGADIRDTFLHAHIGSKPACRACWAKYYCSGGCHANALHANGDILKPYALGCALEKKRLELAIGLLAR
jgi:uncharacterized protein